MLYPYMVNDNTEYLYLMKWHYQVKHDINTLCGDGSAVNIDSLCIVQLNLQLGT